MFKEKEEQGVLRFFPFNALLCTGKRLEFHSIFRRVSEAMNGERIVARINLEQVR